MSKITILEKLTPKQLEYLGSQIDASLAQKQGLRVGESTVVSHYLHSINPLQIGRAHV